MLNNFLSKYNFTYPQVIIYMLQASEYRIKDYFKWYIQVKNFNEVAKRGYLKKTPKSLLLLVFIYLTEILSFLSLGWWFITREGLISDILIIVGLILLPFFLAVVVVVPLILGRIFIQYPLEYFIFKKAKKKLAEHSGLKIAIAGSFGKTSMREILKTVLSEGKVVTAPPHSYNTPLGISQFINTLKGDEEVIIFEFGEYYLGDIKKLCKLTAPDMGIITGINEAHLEKFKDINKTIKTIYELADYLGEKPVYVNGENKLTRNNKREGHILYSREGVADLIVKNKETSLEGTTFEIKNENENIKLESNLLGLHQVGPLVLACKIGFDLGLSTHEVKNGIRKTKPFDHRLEKKENKDGVITLDDSYNGNPDGVKAVIEFLSTIKDHKRIYITPGLVEMGVEKETVHENIGKWLAEAQIEKVILVKNSVTPFIEKGLLKNNYKGEIIWFDEALQLFEALPNLTVRGDVVLIQNDWPDQYQ